MEVTVPGYAPGNIPNDINANGQPSIVTRQHSKYRHKYRPIINKFKLLATISNPNYAIPVNEGKSYTRIIAIRNFGK